MHSLDTCTLEVVTDAASIIGGGDWCGIYQGVNVNWADPVRLVLDDFSAKSFGMIMSQHMAVTCGIVRLFGNVL